MADRAGNAYLELWIAAAGISHRELARRTGTAARARGHTQIAPDATRVRRWLDGERPRPPVPALLAAVLSDATGVALTPGDLGLVEVGPAVDTIQVPLLTEAAAQTVAGWIRMDLFMKRRDALRLAVGAPLVLAATRMLGGTAHAASAGSTGFDTASVAALEEATAFYARADAAGHGALHRPAIVAQLAEVARRISDGVPASLKPRVFAAAADLAALAGWVSHDAGRYGAAQRYWSYGLHAAAEAGQPDRGVEIVTRMSHQMIYLGRPIDALDLLALATSKAEHPTVKALVASQTGRVHAALGDHQAADRHLGTADELLADGSNQQAPAWVAYFDAAEHAGARAVAARDLAAQKQPTTAASNHFRDALALRKPGFDRVRIMDRVGLAAALFHEGDVDQGAAAAHQALDDAARADSALVTSRLNTLLDASRSYDTAAARDVRARTRELTARRSIAVAA